MPRYFFDVHDGQFYDDPTGTELDDLDHARREAVAFFGGLLAETPGRFTGSDVWKVIVRDEQDVLFTFTFAVDTGASNPKAG